MSRLCFVLFAIFIQFSSTVESRRSKDDPIVTVREGKLKGTVEKSIDGCTYYSFKGIPYAQPPVGDLRFKAPLPPQRWQGIRNATEHGSVCAQFNVTYRGSEDCLFLNIYTKSLNPNAKIPVMVFIHGGSFFSGSGDSSTFGPDFLIQHDVILITLNYRLEVLGYLSLNIPEVPGNAGMKDQVAALKWIQNNIDKFGGDKNSVTLFGESSGASAVTYHLLSPMSKGLFHKAIAESGTSIQDWAVARDEVTRAYKVGKLLGKDTNDPYELLSFLQGLEPSALTNLTFKTLTYDETNRGTPWQFLPSAENNFKGIESFINKNSVSLLSEGKVNKVPLMIGYNSVEGLILISYHLERLDIYNEYPSFYVPRELSRIISNTKLNEFGSRIKDFYVGNRNLTKDDLAIIANMQTDMQFSYNIHRFANLYSLFNTVYMYKFNFETDLNIIKISLGLANLKGVCHADELFYLFYNYLSEKPYKQQRKLRSIVDRLTKMWTDFAKTGHPVQEDSDIIWPSYTRSGKEYLNIEENYEKGNFADRERIEFWDKLYAEAGVPHIGNAPQPPSSWNGIRDASKHGSICAQFNNTFQGSEDCLFLNVYTKSLRQHAKMPVMVFIHGGSYYEGSGDIDTFGPDFLIQHNVILVTINYRLELLGFLKLDIPEVPGNAGMKDQVAALKWIQNNIEKFGGDRNSVTIFGESSGASSVTHHILSPMSSGLFQKVIAQSGTSIHDWAIGKDSVARAFRAGKVLGKETNDVSELLQFFRGLDASALTNLTFSTLTPDENYRGLPEKFIPGIEKTFSGVEYFINENPIELIQKGKVNKVPVMAGYNSGEGLIIAQYHAGRIDVYNKEPQYYVNREIAEVVSKSKLNEFGDRIKKFYVGDRNITKDDLQIITDMQTDIHFSYNHHRFAHLYSKLDNVFMYRFNFETDLNIVKNDLGLGNLKGVSHADELFYLFYNYLTKKPYQDQERLRDIVFKVTKLWTDFAKTGYPTPDNYFHSTWVPYTKTGKEYFNIDDSYSVGHYADRERMEFWDNIYAEAGLPHIGS